MRSKEQSIARNRPVTPAEVFSQAADAFQQVFTFPDARRCTAPMLCAILTWAAAYTGSLLQACERLFPGLQDQTVWNLLRTRLPQRFDALERRLTELLNLSWVLPLLHGRRLDIAVDYHAIPYHGAPKKTKGSSGAASRSVALPPSMSMPRSASCYEAGVTPSP
jgi:hypothetical protein